MKHDPYVFSYPIFVLVILVCGGISPAAALPFLQSAQAAGMMTPEYVYIIPYYYKSVLAPWEPWMTNNITNKDEEKMIQYYNNSIVVYLQLFVVFKIIFKNIHRLQRMVTLLSSFNSLNNE